MGIPDNVYFGEKPEGGGIHYGQVREIEDEQRKLEILKKRLDVLLIEQISELAKEDDNNKFIVWSPFPLCVLTLLCIETLGRVISDVKALEDQGPHEISKKLSTPILHLMDNKLSYILTKKFREGFEKIHGTDDKKSVRRYLDVIHKYQRNTFNHGYQAKGVFLEHSIKEMWIKDEENGFMVINPYKFWNRFVEIYELVFKDILESKNTAYRKNALTYFHGLLK